MNSSQITKMSGSNGAPEVEHRHMLDPLGEIERLAKTLCQEDPAHRFERWEDYWAEAEARLVSRLGSYAKGPRVHQEGRWNQLSPEFAELSHFTTPRLLPVLARALIRPLNDHEACCLGYILRTSEVCWSDDTRDMPLAVEKISELLPRLCFDYPPEFYDQAGEKQIALVPTDLKANYWAARLQNIAREDEPLNYSDQNTILRLRRQICMQPEIADLKFEG